MCPRGSRKRKAKRDPSPASPPPPPRSTLSLSILLLVIILMERLRATNGQEGKTLPTLRKYRNAPMDALYHQTNRLAEYTQTRFAVLERASGQDAIGLEAEIQANIDSVLRDCEKLEMLVMKEPLARRATSKMRVDQLLYDSKHLQAALRSVRARREAREREMMEREELLGRRFTANDQGDTSIMIDHALQHHSSMQNAHRGMDELLGSGTSILASLREQRSSLKGVHRKLLDLANTLGLSNSVIRMIERRAYEDKFVLFGGMFVTTVILFLIWKYFG